MEYLELISVPAIATIVYWVMILIKALLMGGASGLTATGTNQIIKQIGKGGDDGKEQ